MLLAPVASAPAPSAAPAPSFRPKGDAAALLDLHGVGFFALTDSQTGYGRATGYESLANARRAAYALSAGAASPAAGVFQQGERFFVRGLAATPAKNPHDATDTPAPGKPAFPGLLAFEGNADAHFAWVRDDRLLLIVDGATKIWSRDAHHPAPAR